MGQSTCLRCGFDRLEGVNVRERVRRPLWGYILQTPIGFLLTSCLMAWFLAWLVHGNPALTRAYFAAGACIVLVTGFLVVHAIYSDPPGFWEAWSDWAREWYFWDVVAGDRGAVGMQSLVVLSCVLIGCAVWLETGLPESERTIMPALGIGNPDTMPE